MPTRMKRIRVIVAEGYGILDREMEILQCRTLFDLNSPDALLFKVVTRDGRYSQRVDHA